MPDSMVGLVRRVSRSGVRRVLPFVGAAIAILVVVRLLLPPVVSTVPANRTELVQTVVATGRVRTLSRAQLGSSVTGIVSRVLVREGAQVRAGQPLVMLDDREARAEVARAQAGLARARAARATLSDVRVTTVAARARAADVAFANAQRNVERVRRLVEAGASAGVDLDSARQTLEAARAERDIAAAEAAAAGATGSDTRSADAAVAEARAAVAVAEARLANTRITAPGPGLVLTRSVEPGDAVQPGRVLLTLSLAGPTQLLAVPDEKDVARLAVGQQALASADAYPDRSFPARVSFVSPAIDPSQGTIEIRLDVDGAPPYLRPDLTVSIQIETARRPDALVVPLAAVQDADTPEPWVLTVTGGRLERRAVTLGIRGDQYVEIQGGLAESEPVVLPPFRDLGPGDRVRTGS